MDREAWIDISVLSGLILLMLLTTAIGSSNTLWYGSPVYIDGKEVSKASSSNTLTINKSKEIYLPVIESVERDGSVTITRINNTRDFFTAYEFEKKLIANYNATTKYQKMLAIRDITKNVASSLDYFDNFQTPFESYYLGRGDCEDYAILIVSFANAYNISHDDIFMAMGTRNRPHSFPIIYFSDEEALEFNRTGGWYVWDRDMTIPIKISETNFKVDTIYNWYMEGGIMKEDCKEFNSCEVAT